MFLIKTLRINRGKKKKGTDLIPVKVMSKRGFLTTVYVRPYERPKEKKLTKVQNQLIMQYLPLAHKIANIYSRKYQYKLNNDDLYMSAVQGLITGITKLSGKQLSKPSEIKKHLGAWINKYTEEVIQSELESIGVIKRFDYSKNTYEDIGYIDSLEKQIYSNEDDNDRKLKDIIADTSLSPETVLDEEYIDEELIDKKMLYLNKLKQILKDNEYKSLFLIAVEGLTYQEAGKRLHLSSVGVLKAVRRAKEKIKENMKYIQYLKKFNILPTPPDISSQLLSITRDKDLIDIAYNISSQIPEYKFPDLLTKVSMYKVKKDDKVSYFYDDNDRLKLIYVNLPDNKYLWVIDNQL